MRRREFITKIGVAMGGAALAGPVNAVTPCPPVLGGGSSACGKGTLAEVAASLSPGQSVDFVAGRNPLTIHAPDISWQCVAVFRDSNRQEIQYAGKPQSGVSTDYSHYIFDEATNTWRTTGQSLFPGSGHIWVATFDPDTGDYYFHRQGEDSIRRMRRSSESWTETSTQPGFRGRSNNTINALVYHPNLFGPGDPGLLAQSVDDVWAWRKASDSWSHVASGSYGKNGQGIYLPWADMALFGGGDFNGFEGSFYTATGGSGGSPPSSINNLGTKGPVTVGGSGGSNSAGKIIIDPTGSDRLLLLEQNGSERVWVSTNNGSSWQSAGNHPFDDLDGYQYNGFTANSIPEYGVVIGLTSRASMSAETFMVWKPNI